MESIKPDIQCLVFVGASVLEAVEKTKQWIYLSWVGGKKCVRDCREKPTAQRGLAA